MHVNKTFFFFFQRMVDYKMAKKMQSGLILLVKISQVKESCYNSCIIFSCNLSKIIIGVEMMIHIQ